MPLDKKTDKVIARALETLNKYNSAAGKRRRRRHAETQAYIDSMSKKRTLFRRLALRAALKRSYTVTSHIRTYWKEEEKH